MKILILGLAKTGATAFYYKIKHSMPAKAKGFFEKYDISKLQIKMHENCIAKNLICHEYFMIHGSAEEFLREVGEEFDKKILILRDPRDTVISTLLYWPFESSEYWNLVNSKFFQLLRKKESDPSSVSTRELLSVIPCHNGTINGSGGPEESAANYAGTKNPWDELYTVMKTNKFFLMKYEDFVDGKTEDLESYLGITLVNNGEDENSSKRFSRIRTYGDWRNWFTPEDVVYFKPQFKKFLMRFGYTNDWTLNKPQVILPEHASVFVEGLVQERMRIEDEKARIHEEEPLKIGRRSNGSEGITIKQDAGYRGTHALETEKKISIILPNRNYAWCVVEAIESVLRQDYTNWELIIIDDGSTDNAPKIFQEYALAYPGKIKLYFHPEKENRGLAASYKLGFEKCAGDYIAFIESDDIWEKDSLSSKARVLDAYSGTALVYNDVEIFGSEDIVGLWKNMMTSSGSFEIKNKPFEAFGYLTEKNIVPTFSCFMVRKEAVEGIDYACVIDAWFDWWLLAQISLRGKFYLLPEKKTRWRKHEGCNDVKYFNEDRTKVHERVSVMRESIMRFAVSYSENENRKARSLIVRS